MRRFLILAAASLACATAAVAAIDAPLPAPVAKVSDFLCRMQADAAATPVDIVLQTFRCKAQYAADNSLISVTRPGDSPAVQWRAGDDTQPVTTSTGKTLTGADIVEAMNLLSDRHAQAVVTPPAPQ